MSYGITDAGFVLKRLADIQAELEAAYRSTFGAGINVDSRSPLGQIIGIHAERESLIWEQMEEVYNSRYPDSASGASLDNLVSITNITRLSATNSRVTARISGTDTTVIPIGFVVSVDGNPTARFATIESGVIGSVVTGYVDLIFDAEETGPVQAPAGTLTEIETPISGVTAVTNALDAVVGRDTETDAQLRIRRLISLSRPGTATVNGIRNAILEIDDVIQANVIENDTGLVDIDGRPAYSIECIVSGGTDADVAAAIFESKAAGIQTYGTESEVVVDSQGMSHTIYFSRPTEVPVYLRITITPNTDPNEGAVYPSNGDDAVEAAILVYVSANYTLGHDVVLSQLYTPINTIEGIFGILVEVSLNGSSWSTSNLSVASDELAIFDSTRITVIS
jgi:uncharacterized phage protein gp47/JayE